jgi:hypothetical protein
MAHHAERSRRPRLGRIVKQGRDRSGAASPGLPEPLSFAPESEPELALEPLTPGFLLKTVGDLRVPTVALSAEIVTVGGGSVKGRIFLPASAHFHEGAMRAEEWLNEGDNFFPFLQDGAQRPAILNRDEVLVMTVAAGATPGEVVSEPRPIERAVVMECGGRRLAGTLAIDMPEEHSRVLDYLNGRGRFVTLRDGSRHHLVQKRRITRVEEARED